MSDLAQSRATAPSTDPPELDCGACAFERLVVLSPDPLCIFDADARIEHANTAFQREMRAVEADLIARPLLDLVHPDDRGAAQAALAALAPGGPPLSLETRCCRADGTEVCFQWRLSKGAGDDRVYATARDVTAQKRIEAELADREARLRAVVESALDALITIDVAGIIESFNPAAERIFGWKAAEVIGKNVSVLMPEPDRSAHDGYIQRYLETGVPRIIGIGREVLGIRKDGTTCVLDLAVTEVPLGARRAFLGILRDIGDQKKVEGMRSALLAREAHQLGRLEMAAGMLHDLGNALTGIGARAVDVQGMLQRAGANEDLGRKMADFLKANAPALEKAFGTAKANALVDLASALVGAQAKTRTEALESMAKLLAFLSHAQELLATHRSYSGAGSAAAREKTRFEKLLFDAQMMMSDTIAKRGGLIVIECPPHLPPVCVERSKLMQVLVNLVKNAGEAFDDAGLGRAPEITLAARSEPSGGVTLEVRDNGPGFVPEMAERLFAEGYSTKGRGSGLGLGSARRLIGSLGGRLELTSPGPGQGASARIHLPKELLSDGRD